MSHTSQSVALLEFVLFVQRVVQWIYSVQFKPCRLLSYAWGPNLVTRHLVKFGSRAGYLTNHALLEFIDQICECFD